MKRKRDDDELDYEGLSLLFDESNEDALVESIDEKVLKQENILPQASGNSVSKVSLNVVNSWECIFSRLIILSWIGSAKKYGCGHHWSFSQISEDNTKNP